MNTPAAKLHPLLMIAALSVTALSLAGIGVLTGVIPYPTGHTDHGPTAVSSPAAAPAQPLPAQTAGAPTAAVAPSPAPVAASPEPAAPVPPPPRKVVHKPAKKAVAVQEPAREAMPGVPPDYVPPPPTAAAPPPPAPPLCRECGVVESFRQVVKEGQGTGLGAVAGGLVGGVVGNQIGHGGSRDVARMLGIVGGAVAGHEIEKSQRKSSYYEITVRMDDGTSRTVNSEVQPAWRAGDRVKISNGTLIPGS